MPHKESWVKKSGREAKIAWLAGLLIAVAVAALFLFSLPKTERQIKRNDKPEIKEAPGVMGADTVPPKNDLEIASASLNTTLQKLKAGDSAQMNSAYLKELKAALDRLSPEQAAALIEAFFTKGDDAETRIKFSVGQEGYLNGSPSLRIFLLDYLGAKNPQAGADLALTVFAKSQSPDEWAVALRNYARAARTPDEMGVLNARTRDLLNNDAWLNGNSVGVLEAFDTVVYAKDFSALPRLTSLAKPEGNKAVGHAAFLTMDRLALADPASFMRVARQNEQGFAGRELMRANLFARADVRVLEQLHELESYLLDAQRSQEELTTFAGVYPNANYMISTNLLTKIETPDREELASHDRAAFEQTERWLMDPRFAKIRPQVEVIKSRLQHFVPLEK